MKRFHVNISVADLEASVAFYSKLFAAAPTVLKEDYAKWMLEDPRVNVSLSSSAMAHGINHVGIQAENENEFAEIQARLRSAAQELIDEELMDGGSMNQASVDQVGAECCYAKSSKTWVRDPDAVRWEGFLTFGELTRYGSDAVPVDLSNSDGAKRCCAVESDQTCCL